MGFVVLGIGESMDINFWGFGYSEILEFRDFVILWFRNLGSKGIRDFGQWGLFGSKDFGIQELLVLGIKRF